MYWVSIFHGACIDTCASLISLIRRKSDFNRCLFSWDLLALLSPLRSVISQRCSYVLEYLAFISQDWSYHRVSGKSNDTTAAAQRVLIQHTSGAFGHQTDPGPPHHGSWSIVILASHDHILNFLISSLKQFELLWIEGLEAENIFFLGVIFG